MTPPADRGQGDLAGPIVAGCADGNLSIYWNRPRIVTAERPSLTHRPSGHTGLRSGSRVRSRTVHSAVPAGRTAQDRRAVPPRRRQACSVRRAPCDRGRSTFYGRGRSCFTRKFLLAGSAVRRAHLALMSSQPPALRGNGSRARAGNVQEAGNVHRRRAAGHTAWSRTLLAALARCGVPAASGGQPHGHRQAADTAASSPGRSTQDRRAKGDGQDSKGEDCPAGFEAGRGGIRGRGWRPEAEAGRRSPGTRSSCGGVRMASSGPTWERPQRAHSAHVRRVVKEVGGLPSYPPRIGPPAPILPDGRRRGQGRQEHGRPRRASLVRSGLAVVWRWSGGGVARPARPSPDARQAPTAQQWCGAACPACPAWPAWPAGLRGLRGPARRAASAAPQRRTTAQDHGAGPHRPHAGSPVTHCGSASA